MIHETPLSHGIAMHSGGRRKRIVYQPDGSSGGSNSSFTFCDRRGFARPRVICLSNTGRPRLSMTRCDGKPVACGPAG
jgi:type IV fimbrial biogenesis protein FimT